MRLFYKCSNCNQSNKISALLVGDRLELARKKGVEFESRCQKCGSNHKVHVDDVEAENDLTIPISFVLAFSGVVLSLVGFLYDFSLITVLFSSITALLPFALMSYERNKIKAFNFAKYDSKRGR